MSLNSICPYYTMYPLSFPLGYLRRHGRPGTWVLDPFCGRGTTNFAARLCNMPSVGIDTSPIAVAISRAKLVTTTQRAVIACLDRILVANRELEDVPTGEFWMQAYHPQTLSQLCCVREALLDQCDSSARIVLRAIMLGALHGPVNRHRSTYFSNQCPRTFSPKPAYAVRFWKKHRFRAPKVDVRDIVRIRAEWYLTDVPEHVEGDILHSDSRAAASQLATQAFDFVITSPPYYGMRTYIPDQWLRNWFLGGPAHVVYQQSAGELPHSGPEHFSTSLRQVWKVAAANCKPSSRLLCRFGGIRDRSQEPRALLEESLRDSGWKLLTIRNAGSSSAGKRQAEQFGERIRTQPRDEFDAYAERVV